MTAILYRGEIWKGPAVHPELWGLLAQHDRLIEIQSGDPPIRVVVGVPHHATTGASQIAEHWRNPITGKPGRAADENTALFGLAMLTTLQELGVSARLVVAAHPTDNDPNKTPGSPYWQRIFAPPLPGMLFELHGAARKRKHDLELSAGKNRHADPLAFGQEIFRRTDGGWVIALQSRPASGEARVYTDHRVEAGRLQNPALKTHSLAHAGTLGLPALHLEMKVHFRQPDPAFPFAPQPGQAGWKLARVLADVFHDWPG